ncbi:hypothetical protein OKA05_00670 [Luteolibacter arcticus]|uniref:Uncharacterized protein n=1 Tax=Luteolibacter arcticus TaxID=1581411 RepID=A0ABT3GBP3_9BACT|nr:DUF6678 family protein [Luteolibacter arcticus]MCW1921045.1 hypothetical protein [Luteolibacter arcticus]
MRPAVLQALEERGLTSVMNATKWRELRDAVARELPFAPAFQRKDVLSSDAYPQTFDQDVRYGGDWPAGTDLSSEIEWICVRPRRLIHRGNLVAPAIEDIEEQFLALLGRLQIPFARDSETITIYGYSANPGALTTHRQAPGE